MKTLILMLVLIGLYVTLKPSIDIGRVGNKSALFLWWGPLEYRKFIKVIQW